MNIFYHIVLYHIDHYWIFDCIHLDQRLVLIFLSTKVFFKLNLHISWKQGKKYVGPNYFNSTGDSLSYHNGMKFTTYDNDNDKNDGSNCAVSFKSAWWHRSCHFSGLNGQYGIDTPSGIIWYHWRGYDHSLVRAQMMVRRKIKHQY